MYVAWSAWRAGVFWDVYFIPGLWATHACKLEGNLGQEGGATRKQGQQTATG